MKVFKPETDAELSTGQKEIEAQCLARTSSTRPFRNKKGLPDQALEPEPRVKLQVPKPEPCEVQEGVQLDYDCALDKLSKLDKRYEEKNFGFYGKSFRSTHANVLNFFKFRKANSVGHPNARFGIDEDDFRETNCDLYFEKPTPEEYFYQKTITYGCDDHRLKMANDERNARRSSDAKELCEKRKELLKQTISTAGNDEYAYDDLVSDIAELFLFADMTRARMPVTCARVYHVDNVAAVKSHSVT